MKPQESGVPGGRARHWTVPSCRSRPDIDLGRGRERRESEGGARAVDDVAFWDVDANQSVEAGSALANAFCANDAGLANVCGWGGRHSRYCRERAAAGRVKCGGQRRDVDRGRRRRSGLRMPSRPFHRLFRRRCRQGGALRRRGGQIVPAENLGRHHQQLAGVAGAAGVGTRLAGGRDETTEGLILPDPLTVCMLPLYRNEYGRSSQEGSRWRSRLGSGCDSALSLLFVPTLRRRAEEEAVEGPQREHSARSHLPSFLSMEWEH